MKQLSFGIRHYIQTSWRMTFIESLIGNEKTAAAAVAAVAA
jgi:hypothetical protein